MKKLYVGNLPFQATEEDVRNWFTEAGVTPANVTLVRDRFSGQPRGFGFVEVNNDEDAGTAIQALNGHDFMGRNVVVNEARPPSEGGGRVAAVAARWRWRPRRWRWRPRRRWRRPRRRWWWPRRRWRRALLIECWAAPAREASLAPGRELAGRITSQQQDSSRLLDVSCRGFAGTLAWSLADRLRPVPLYLPRRRIVRQSSRSSPGSPAPGHPAPLRLGPDRRARRTGRDCAAAGCCSNRETARRKYRMCRCAAR